MTKERKKGQARPQVVKDPFLEALQSAFGDEFDIFNNGAQA